MGLAMQFKKADKKQAKLRCSIFGPSGAGKTFTALRIAKGFLESDLIPDAKIAVIDTERGSASKYADRFEFDVLELDSENQSIDHYIAAMNAAKENGYNILVIDSLSHAWQELLQEVDKLAQTKFKGNTFSAWSQGTPKQKKLINAILDFPGHIITTIRSKTEWTIGEDKKVKREGLSPEQGKGIEYEFDLLIEMNQDHFATVIKDRTGKYQDNIMKCPDEKFGKELVGWLNEGAPEEPKKENPTTLEKDQKNLDGLDKALKEAIQNNDLDRINTKTYPGWEKLKENKQISDVAYKKGIEKINFAINEIGNKLEEPEEQKEEPKKEAKKKEPEKPKQEESPPKENLDIAEFIERMEKSLEEAIQVGDSEELVSLEKGWNNNRKYINPKKFKEISDIIAKSKERMGVF